MLIDRLHYKLDLDNSDFKRGVKESYGLMGNMEGKMSGWMKGGLIAGAVIGGITLIGTTFVNVAKRAVEAASAMEETRNKFNVVFGDLSSKARAWAEDFGKAVGRSETDIEEWMARLQDTFVPLGFSRDKAFELSSALTKLAVDVASFNNASDPETIQLFTSALVGNHEAVRRFGIIISETSLKQAALDAGIKKQFSDLTDLEKVQLRYNIILNSTKDAQGDAIRTADGYANQVKRMNAEMKGMWENLGKLFIPAFTSFVKDIGEVSGAIGKFFDSLKPKVLDDYIEKLKELGAATSFVATIEAQRRINEETERRLTAQKEIKNVLMTVEEAENRVEIAKKRQLEATQKIAQELVNGNKDAAKQAEEYLDRYTKMETEAKKFLDNVNTIKEATENIKNFEQTIADIKAGRLNMVKEETGEIIKQVKALEDYLAVIKETKENLIPVSGGQKGAPTGLNNYPISAKFPTKVEAQDLKLFTSQWDEMWSHIVFNFARGKTSAEDWIRTGEKLVTTLWKGDEAFANFMSGVSEFAYGVATGKVTDVFSGLVTIFSELTSSSYDAGEATKQLKEELESYRNEIMNYTLAQLQEQEKLYEGRRGFQRRGAVQVGETHGDILEEGLKNFGKFTDDWQGILEQWNYQVSIMDIDDPSKKLAMFVDILKQKFGIELPADTKKAQAAIDVFLQNLTTGKNAAEAWQLAFGFALPAQLTGRDVRDLIAQFETLLDDMTKQQEESIAKSEETVAFTRTKQITFRQADVMIEALWSIDQQARNIYQLMSSNVSMQGDSLTRSMASSFNIFANVVTVNSQQARIDISRADVNIAGDGASGSERVSKMFYESVNKSYRAAGVS